MASYNRTRYVEDLLERTAGSPPSFTVHLHPEYWTLNNGSKFLYNNQIASLLDDIRSQRIPVDFLDLFHAAKVPFYDGCMIVELLDYRPQRNKENAPEKPERTRVVLHPNDETLWADICLLNRQCGGKFTDRDALELEAKLLLSISTPLCLDPNPHLTRIANHILRVSTPTTPASLKRKAAALEPEQDEVEKARRMKIMQFMAPRQPLRTNPSYRVLEAIQRSKQQAKAATPQPIPPSQNQVASARQSPAQASTPVQNLSQAHSPASMDDKKLKIKKSETPQMAFATTAFTRANRSQTPVAQPVTHQFISQNPSAPTPMPHAQSPMQPQVYPSIQAATEAAKRTPTPAQHYTQPPRPPSSQPLHQPQTHRTPTPQAASQQQAANVFAQQVPPAHYIQAAQNGMRMSTPKIHAPGAGQTTAQQLAANPALMLYAQQLQGQQIQQQQAAAMLQQRFNAALAIAAAQKNGRSTPQVPPVQSTPSPVRSSPLVTAKAIGPAAATRSPMPSSAQQLPQTPQQQQAAAVAALAHQNQHAQQMSYSQYNAAAAAAVAAHLRPMVHGGAAAQHAQAAMQAHMSGAMQQQQQQHQKQQQQGQQPQQSANNAAAVAAALAHHQAAAVAADGQQQGQGQQQTPMHPYQMYRYPMNFAMRPGGVPAYWPVGMGGGMHGLVNGQQMQAAKMAAANAQQMSLNMGQAGPAGVQGQ